MRKIEGLVAGKDADTGHAILLLDAAEVIFPIGPGEVHAADGATETGAVGAAFGGEALVDAREIFVEQRLEAAGPRFYDAMASELGDELRGVVVFEATEWSTKEIDVGVDGRSGRRAGGSCRRKF